MPDLHDPLEPRIRVVVEVPKDRAKTEKEAVWYIRRLLVLGDEEDHNWGERVKEYTRVIAARGDGPEEARKLNEIAAQLNELAAKIRQVGS